MRAESVVWVVMVCAFLVMSLKVLSVDRKASSNRVVIEETIKTIQQLHD